MDPQLEQALVATQEFMQQYGIDARTMASIGQMAEQAIQDPSLYAMLREQLIGAGILDEEDLPEQTNYMALAALVAMGALAGGM
jgi:dsRNA-specific ribonuclease